MWLKCSLVFSPFEADQTRNWSLIQHVIHAKSVVNSLSTSCFPQRLRSESKSKRRLCFCSPEAPLMLVRGTGTSHYYITYQKSFGGVFTLTFDLCYVFNKATGNRSIKGLSLKYPSDQVKLGWTPPRKPKLFNNQFLLQHCNVFMHRNDTDDVLRIKQDTGQWPGSQNRYQQAVRLGYQKPILLMGAQWYANKETTGHSSTT